MLLILTSDSAGTFVTQDGSLLGTEGILLKKSHSDVDSKGTYVPGSSFSMAALWFSEKGLLWVTKESERVIHDNGLLLSNIQFWCILWALKVRVFFKKKTWNQIVCLWDSCRRDIDWWKKKNMWFINSEGIGGRQDVSNVATFLCLHMCVKTKCILWLKKDEMKWKWKKWKLCSNAAREI